MLIPILFYSIRDLRGIHECFPYTTAVCDMVGGNRSVPGYALRGSQSTLQLIGTALVRAWRWDSAQTNWYTLIAYSDHYENNQHEYELKLHCSSGFVFFFYSSQLIFIPRPLKQLQMCDLPYTFLRIISGNFLHGIISLKNTNVKLPRMLSSFSWQSYV